ncbi:MAG: hypothetical protein WDW19_05830 [Neisseriaceae bacterium]
MLPADTGFEFGLETCIIALTTTRYKQRVLVERKYRQISTIGSGSLQPSYAVLWAKTTQTGMQRPATDAEEEEAELNHELTTKPMDAKLQTPITQSHFETQQNQPTLAWCSKEQSREDLGVE